MTLIVSGQYVPPPSPEIGPEYSFILDDFRYELQYEDVEAEMDISRAAAVKLKRKLRHKVSGVVSLLFEVILLPAKAFK